MNIVILAAGRGARFQRPYPKALAVLADGRSILQRQLDLLDGAFGPDTPVCIVVGFQATEILEAAGRRATFAYNEAFDRTSTARSLLRALRTTGPGDVLWLNGDVVFDPGVVARLAASVRRDEGLVAVTQTPVGEEEVKYQLDGQGYVRAISKTVSPSAGEAVGINYLPSVHRSRFTGELARCSDDDYFERAIEASSSAGLRFRAVDVTDCGCVEVDFQSDLPAANRVVGASAIASRGG